MEASKEFYKLLALLPVGCAAITADTADIIYTNLAARELLEIDISGRPLAKLSQERRIIDLDGKDLPLEEYATARAISTGKEATVTSGLIVNGVTKWLEVTAVPVSIDDRAIILTTFTDVTSLIEAQMRVTEAMQNMSHELRTPLALIYGYLSLIDEGQYGELSPALNDAICSLVRRTQTLMAMTERMLYLLTMDANAERQFGPVDISKLCRQAKRDVEVLLEAAGKSARIQSRCVIEDGLIVTGNEHMLQYMLNNLVSNAVKFTESGEISLVCGENGDDIVISVTDTGIGMSTADRIRIFDRFYQVSQGMTRRYGGMGIGLNFVKGVVEIHGGRIEVDSEVGRGTTFTVHLPIGER